MGNDAKAIQELFDNVSLGAPENAVGFVLWRLVVRYQREVDRALASLELTNLQFVTLALTAWLGRSGEAVTQSELARSSGIHPMQVSHMMKTLESKEFISRKRSKLDVRAKRVKVSRKGLNVLRKALPMVIKVQQRLFGDEGRPGGRFINTLLQLDSERSDRSEPI